MIRPRRLERRIDAALTPVVEAIEDLTAATEDRAGHDEILAHHVARVDARIEAVHEQHAARMAAVRAELAAARGESITAGIVALTERATRAEERCADLERQLEVVTYERDAARHNADGANASVASWSESWHALRASHGELFDVCAALDVLAGRAIEKVPAKTTRARYEAQRASLTPRWCPPDDETDSVELADSA